MSTHSAVFIRACAVAMLAIPALVLSADVPLIDDVPSQPLWAQARRIIEALDYLGNPLPEVDNAALDAAAKTGDGPTLVKAIQKTFDPHCLLAININPESRVKVAQGPAAAQLVEHGWRQFLI